MVLISATAFGTLSILAKLAYDTGLGTFQLLAFRFVLAAGGIWVLALLVGGSVCAPLAGAATAPEDP